MTVMAGTISTTEIVENSKIAREMVMMGDYDSAGIYYESVLQLLQKLILGVTEPMRKGKWTLVSVNI